MVHPSLYADPVLLSQLKDRLATDPALAAKWDDFRKKGEQLLQQPLYTQDYAESANDQHGKYYDLGKQMMAFGETLGLLYAVTGEEQYAQKLKEAMLHYGTFDRWTGPANRFRVPPWHSDLATTQLLYGYAVGFDFCADFFTRDEIATITDRMKRLGILPLMTDWLLPETRVHALDSMGHNWWSVCIGFAGIGILSIREYLPEAEEWMNLILPALREFCRYPGAVLHHKCPNLDKDGLFYESLGYSNYGLGELLRFAFLYLRSGGDPREVTYPELAHASEAILQFLYPVTGHQGPAIPLLFGDTNAHQDIRLYAGFRLLYGEPDPAIRPMLRYCYGFREGYDMLDFLYEDILRNEDKSPLHFPKTEKHFASGTAILRSSWEPDATLLAVRSSYSWNHAHQDAGSFLLYDKGVPLLSDSGCCDYGHPLYSSYYRREAAHNLVLINGGGDDSSIERGSKFPGSIPHLLSGGGMTYLLADATGPTSRFAERNYRHFLWIDHEILVIIDDIRTYEPYSLDWLLHYEGRAETASGKIHILNGPAQAIVEPVFPKDSTLSVRTGYEPHHPDLTKPYLAITPAERRRVEQFITVIKTGTAMEEVTVLPLEEKEVLGVKLLRKGREDTTVYYNLRADGRRMHMNSNHCLGGYETDAYLLALRKDAILMGWGSYLRKSNTILHSSFDKQFRIL